MQAKAIMIKLSRACIPYLVVVAGLAWVTPAFADKVERNFAGSIQLDYMAIPTESVGIAM